MSLNYAQTNTLYQSGSGSTIGATSVVLTSLKDIYGNVLTMADFGAKGYITLEPDTTNEEGATFTGITANSNGTYSLTGVSTILAVSPYTETSGLVREHAGGTSIVITDNVAFWNTFGNKQNNEILTGVWGTANAPTNPNDLVNKAYADGLAIAGGANASSTVKGISKLSIDPVLNTNPIAVGDNDTRVPTQGENDALAGNNGTPSSTNRFITESGLVIGIPTGVVQMYVGNSSPTGWLLCDGSPVSRITYATLFGIISINYGGGDGLTTFNVPDMRGRVPIGKGVGIGGGVAGIGLPTGGSALASVSLGSWKGEETHQLIIGELAAHTHPVTVIQGSSNDNTGVKGQGTPSSSGNVPGAAISTGGDAPHNNIQPVMGINFIIKT